MAEEHEPTLIPKGARIEAEAPVDPKNQLGLNTPQTIVNDTPDARRELVIKNRRLEEQVNDLKKKLVISNEENSRLKNNATNSGELQKQLEQAKQALADMGGGEHAMDRRARRWQLLNSIITGLAAKGELFGPTVKAENLTNAINHAVGVAMRTEDAAVLRGF